MGSAAGQVESKLTPGGERKLAIILGTSYSTEMKIASLLLIMAASMSATLLLAEAPNPATLKDKINIVLGDKAVVQFHVEGDVLNQPKVVTKPDSKTPTVTFDFSKQDNILILATKNPFPKTLKFRVMMRMKGRTNYVETNILPIMAGLSSYESWGDPIEDLILFDFKLSDQK